MHVNAGAAALAAALYLGRRRGFGTGALRPHNVPMVLLGAGILWFGWFGFNAGSALSAGSLASSAFVATHLGAAGGMLGWLVPERLRHGQADHDRGRDGRGGGAGRDHAGIGVRRPRCRRS